MQWVAAIVQGVLVGGLYALFAAGLSLIFGVMRLVNIAHGDLIVLAAFVALVVIETLGLGALESLVVVIPVMAVLGYVLQRGLLNFTLGNDILPPLLVTFGLSVIIQNALLQVFTADSRRLNAGPIEVATFNLAGIDIGVLPLVMFLAAVAVIGGLQFVFYRTALGRAFRATSDNAQVARMMGLDNRHIFGLAMALSLAVVAIAGVFLAVRTNFDPASGPARLIFGFEAVIIGGLGNLWGTLARRRHPRRGAGHRRPDRPRLAAARRPPRLPRRAGVPADRLLPAGDGMSVTTTGWRVERATPASRIAAIVAALVAIVARRRAGHGPTAPTCGSSPRSSPTSRSPACGTCSPASPASSRSASRPMSASAATCSSPSPCSSASTRSSPSRSPVSSARWSRSRWRR